MRLSTLADRDDARGIAVIRAALDAGPSHAGRIAIPVSDEQSSTSTPANQNYLRGVQAADAIGW